MSTKKAIKQSAAEDRGPDSELHEFAKWRNRDIENQRRTLTKAKRQVGKDDARKEEGLALDIWSRDWWEPVDAWFLVNGAIPPEPADKDFWDRVEDLLTLRGDAYLLALLKGIEAKKVESKNGLVSREVALRMAKKFSLSPHAPFKPGMLGLQSAAALLQKVVPRLGEGAAYQRIKRATDLTRALHGEVVFDEKFQDFLKKQKEPRVRRARTNIDDELSDNFYLE